MGMRKQREKQEDLWLAVASARGVMGFSLEKEFRGQLHDAGRMALTTWPKVELLILPLTDWGPKNWTSGRKIKRAVTLVMF